MIFNYFLAFLFGNKFTRFPHNTFFKFTGTSLLGTKRKNLKDIDQRLTRIVKTGL